MAVLQTRVSTTAARFGRAALIALIAGIGLSACSGGAPVDDGSGYSGDDGDGGPAKPSDAVARAALQRYFDAHPQCTPFFTLPHDVPVTESYDQRMMQAFVEAGVVRSEGIIEKPVGNINERFHRYAATPAGNAALRPGDGRIEGSGPVICYGTRQVTDVRLGEVDSMTPEISVKYHYRLTRIPDWAKSPAITAFYSGLSDRLNTVQEADETLTFKDGQWQLLRMEDNNMYDLRQQGR